MSDNTTSHPAPHDENQLIAERRDKLRALREAHAQGAGVTFPNDFKPAHHAATLQDQHASKDAQSLETHAVHVSVAGRMMLKRVMGKASFATVQDGSLGSTGGRIQLYITRDALGEELYAAFKHWDLGDIIGAEGTAFKTKTGELSIKVTTLRLLTKSLRPMPDKFHGIHDQEVKYRQRYIDLMTDEQARKRFVARSKAVSGIRDFMVQHGFLEVETPMLHPIPGGANAKPFVTHHNALDQDMFLRIAPELYLKRLIVGGFERVFEINRSFRNEGIDTRHNPEFTMVEMYQAYTDYQGMMELAESLISSVTKEVLGTTTITYQGNVIELGSPWKRVKYVDIVKERTGIDFSAIKTAEEARAAAKSVGVKVDDDEDSIWKIADEVFSERVEGTLIQPTFMTDYPKELSPLAKSREDDPSYVERFELFIAGREMANAFTELNDPFDQKARFEEQVKMREAGDDEAQMMDLDYIAALEYGLPPAGGMGIGIDRFVMLLVDTASIKDTILFPLLRPETK